MAGRTRVSVIIPHYGEPAPTIALVGALRGQTAPPVEVIVVDDRSPEAFPDVEDVRVVRRTVNGGFGSAVNSGAAVAEGELMLVLNSDVEIGPDFLAELLERAEPWLPAVVSPLVVDGDGTPAWTARRFPTTRQSVVEWLVPLARWRHTELLHRAVGHDPGPSRDAEAPADQVTDWVVGAAMLLPTADFRAVGGFDERFFMNSEEVDLQRRLRESGLPAVALGGPRLLHHGGGSSESARRREWLLTSRLAYADKWGGAAPLRAGLASATAVNLAWGGVRRLAGRPVHPWRDARRDWAVLARRRATPTAPPGVRGSERPDHR